MGSIPKGLSPTVTSLRHLPPQESHGRVLQSACEATAPDLTHLPNEGLRPRAILGRMGRHLVLQPFQATRGSGPARTACPSRSSVSQLQRLGGVDPTAQVRRTGSHPFFQCAPPLHRSPIHQRGNALGSAATGARSRYSRRAMAWAAVMARESRLVSWPVAACFHARSGDVSDPCSAHSRTNIRGISDRGTGDISARPRFRMASRAAATFDRKSLQSSPNISPVVPATLSRPLASWLIAPS